MLILHRRRSLMRLHSGHEGNAAALGIAISLVLVAASFASAASFRGSAAESSPAAASSYGSGSFGTWLGDRFGLPAFRYEIDEETDPRASQPELAGGRQAQHQVGNDHIVAAAFNHGYTQLWSQDRLAEWTNRYDADTSHYAGGYGYLSVDGETISTLYLDRPPGAVFERDFGVGYFRRSLTFDGIAVEETTYAPFGDDPVLLDDVTITNQTTAARALSWFEYWDVNPYDQTAQQNRGLAAPVWDPASSTLSVAQEGSGTDADPLTIFAAALAGSVDGHETSLAAFFGGGTRAAPEAVTTDQLAGSLAPPSADGAPGDTLFAFRSRLSLEPGQTVTLRYVYGTAHPDQVGSLVATYRAQSDPLAASERAWASWLPRANFGASFAWVARELAWDAYLLRSASVYEEVCGHHTITQGGYYQYQSGLNLGSRSWLHYLLPITYSAPELAREILRYSIGLQTQSGNELPYGTGPLCSLYNQLGVSDDLDFWLLLAAAEYGLASRDTAFFSEQLPFYDTHALASAWEHVKLAYRHQETLRGPHGGYLAGTNGDWSDFSATFLQMTESMLVTAQLAYALPRLAELAERLEDPEFASELRTRSAELLEVERREWTGKGWYSRGYSGDRQIGAGAIFGEPQPWAILAGAPAAAQAGTLVANIRRFLDGVGAPPIVHGPARIGSALTPAFNDPDVTERAPGGVGDNVSNYVGGVWFDVNGWLTWALGELDGVLPNARALAWSEYTRNTLANHATQFPDHWAGTISIDDACWAYYSSQPERCGIPLFDQYDGQITEQATWMVMDAIRLAGITPTRDGYVIAPHLPFETFSLELPQVGIAARGRELSGYLRTDGADTIELQVHLPRVVPAASIRTLANGRIVPHVLDGQSVVFPLVTGPDVTAQWTVTWGPPRLRVRAK